MKKLSFIALIVLALLMPFEVWAACPCVGTTCTADTLTRADFATCVTNASALAGAVSIILPAGDETWATAVAVNMTGWSATSLLIDGAGNGLTHIRGAVAATGMLITAKTGVQVEVKDIAMYYPAKIRFEGCPDTLKIHGNHFESTVSYVMVEFAPTSDGVCIPNGVVYENYFLNTKAEGYATAASSWFTSTEMDQIWAMQPVPGATTNTIYIEGNIFEKTVGGNFMDGNCGLRFVYRFNTGSGTVSHIEGHSVQGSNRGIQWWEMYRNSFNSADPAAIAGSLRGGSGVVFDNRLSGSTGTRYVTLDNVRGYRLHSWTHDGGDGLTTFTRSAGGITEAIGGLIYNRTTGAKGTITAYTGTTISATMTGGTRQLWNNGDTAETTTLGIANSGGLCDGTMTNGEDGNTGAGTEAGYPCRDQVGRSYDAVQWDYDSVPVTAYNQPLTPAYVWGNYRDGDVIINGYSPTTQTYNTIAANRDFYNQDTTNCKTTGCTAGIGLGAIATAPATCTDNTGWVDNTVSPPKLYKCASNAWVEYFTPATCPHPLTGYATGTCSYAAGAYGAAAYVVTGATEFPLSVVKLGDGTGTVTSDVGGIDCGSTCGAAYDGDTVTLTATPAAGSYFTGWSGDGTGTTTREVTVSATKSVTATFVNGRKANLSEDGSGGTATLGTGGTITLGP